MANKFSDYKKRYGKHTPSNRKQPPRPPKRPLHRRWGRGYMVERGLDDRKPDSYGG